MGDNMHMSIKENLKREMDRVGMTQYALEKLSGVKQSSIGRILSGDTHSPKEETVRKLAKALNIETGRLMDAVVSYGPLIQFEQTIIGPGGTSIAEQKNDDIERQKLSIAIRSVPMLDNQEIIEDKRPANLDVSNHKKWTTTDQPSGKNSYGYKVSSSVLGNIGAVFQTPLDVILIVDPDIKPANGDIALIIDPSNNIMIKRLDFDGPNTYLGSLNIQHAPILMTQDFKFKGIVVSMNFKTR